MRSRWVLLVGLLALGVLTAGCLLDQDAETDPAQVDPPSPPPEQAASDGEPAHTLTVRGWEDAELADVLAVQAVHAQPVPASIASFQLGPADADEQPIVLARFNVSDGQRLESFRLDLTVDDGLGPAQLSLEVPAWRAQEDAQIDVRLQLVEIGEATIASVDGDLPVEVVDERAEPRYGYLVWPHGDRQPIDGLDRIVQVPAAYPRFPADAEPAFRADEPVRWRLDGQLVAEGRQLATDPGPGSHTLTVVDPATDQETQLAFSLHDRFAHQGEIGAGSAEHRGSLAGVNEDTYNLTVHEGVRSLSARLEPVGNQTDVENLDLYVLNETGAVLAQSVTNGTHEHLRVGHSDLAHQDQVRLRVHGEKAALTEYRLSGTAFYWPW